jgi:hypothetical protein
MPTDNEYLRQIASRIGGATPTAPTDGRWEVGGNLSVATGSFTRPNDTIAYAAGDAIANATSAPTAYSFSNVGRVAGAGGYITKAICQITQVPTTAQLRLHLFRNQPTVDADNVPLVFRQELTYQGYIDFTTFITGGDGSQISRSIGQLCTVTGLPYHLNSDSTSLFFLLQSLNAWTPQAQQMFDFRLSCDRY